MDLRQSEENIINAVKSFRLRIQDVLKPFHDDKFLLRWLRARNYNLEQAESMFREDIRFRRLVGSDTITEWYQIKQEWKDNLFTTLLGFDYEGHPVRLFNYRSLDIKGIIQCSTFFDLQELMIFMCEQDKQLLVDHNQKKNYHVETNVYIADYANFNHFQFTSKMVFQLYLKTCQVYLNHYPETLHRVYIINTPQVFSIFYDLFKPFIADTVLRKVKIYGHSGWQDELLSTIPSEIIPPHLGGSRYQPNGDIYCNDIKIVNEKIPKSAYLPQYPPRMSDADAGVKIAFLAQRSAFKASQEVTSLGLFLCWRFQLKAYDIHFSLTFTPSQKIDDTNNTIEIFPLHRVECCNAPEYGRYMCEEYGTYTFTFDNSSSWFRSKDLLYKIGLVPPRELDSF